MDDLICGKCKKKTKDSKIKCSGNCNAVFHVKCVELSTADYQTTQNCKNVRWFCDGCLYILENMWGLKDAITVLQSQVLTEMSEMKKMFTKSSDASKTEMKSYAKAAAGETVIIKPKNASQESKKTLEVVQRYVDPAALEVGINEIRTVKDGGVVIKCNSKEEIKKIKSVAEKKMGKSYKVNTPELKNPNIKVLDIGREMTNEELLEAIKKQNVYINHDYLSLSIKVIKRMKTKWMAIIECDPVTFKRIMDANGLFIDWSRCRVYEYINIYRCFKCGGFDHKANECTKSGSRCLRCAEAVSGHDNGNQCDCETLKCLNCIEANEVLKTDFNIFHSIFDVSCPVLLKKTEIQRKKIKYSIDLE